MANKTVSLFPKVLNAGISLHMPFEELAEEELGTAFRKLMDVNYMGYVHCTYYALPYLRASRGKICVVSSMSGSFLFLRLV